MSLLTRFLNVFRSRALEQEFDDELRFHLHERIASNLEHGMSQVEAELAASRQFGSVERAKRDMREMRMMNRQFVAGLMVGLLVAGIPAGLLWIRISEPPAPQDMGFYIPGDEGVKSPVLIREQKPQYTAEALQAKVSGSVLMRCVVQTTGTCSHIQITRQLHPDLDQQAVKALQAWRFQPGTRRGEPVPTMVTIEIAYNCRGCPPAPQ
jgi:TonB family protein